jgi:hypothetical protein
MYMNNAVQSLHGCVGHKLKGWKARIGIACVSALCLTSVLGPGNAGAAQSPLTHLQYIQMMTQVMGDSGLFSAGSTAGDYIQWARNKGMNPGIGWSASTPVSAQLVAETWVQLLGLPSRYGSDYFRTLDSQGIHIDRTGMMTHAALAALLDQPESQSRMGQQALLCLSPIKPLPGIGYGFNWNYPRGIISPVLPPIRPPGHGHGHGHGHGGRY